MSDLFGTDSGASFSDDRKHRFALWRIWNESLPFVMFIGLNPSTANESDNDPTIRSVCRIAKNNGYGGVYMMNCFSFVSTDPKGIINNHYSLRWNDYMLSTIAYKCQDVVFAWGNFDIVRETGRDKELCEMFPNALALQINKNGSPKHPLYVSSKIKPIKYAKADSDH